MSSALQSDKLTATPEVCQSRRRFLSVCGGAAAALLVQPAFAGLASGEERILRFNHLHTGEKLNCAYWCDGQYQPEALAEINHLLRDFRTGEQYPMDPALLDMLHKLQRAMDSRQPFEIISGYRSPKTNNLLRNSSSGVAKKSLHMQGKALDIRLPGRDLNQLRLAARSLRAGGVGYYPDSNFIHVDTGRVRYW